MGGAAPPPSAPASHFPGCTESVPSPQRAPRLVVRRTHAQVTPRAACQPPLAEQGSRGGVHPDCVFQRQLFRWERAWGLPRTQSGQKRQNTILRCVCRSKHRKSWVLPPSVGCYAWLCVGCGPGTAVCDTKAGDRGWWLRLSAVSSQLLLSRVQPSCLGAEGTDMPCVTCTFLWSP